MGLCITSVLHSKKLKYLYCVNVEMFEVFSNVVIKELYFMKIFYVVIKINCNLGNLIKLFNHVFNIV